jgi:O-antigen/teichoic acid export membrane protein
MSEALPHGDSRPILGRLLTNSLFTTISTIIVGVGGFAIQAIGSKELPTREFGEAFAVMSFYALVGRPSTIVGRLVAWQASRDFHPEKLAQRQSITMLRVLSVLSFLVGCLVLFGSLVGRDFIEDYLRIPVYDILIAALATPFLLGIQPLLGMLQGESRFRQWSTLNMIVTIFKLLFVVILIARFQVFGFLLGTTMGTIAAYVLGLWYLREQMFRHLGVRHVRWRTYIPFVLTGVASKVLMGVLLSLNIILVEHYFDHHSAGHYAIVALVGNAILYATGGIASAVYPSIASRQSQAISTLRIMVYAVLGTAIIAVIAIIALHSAESIIFEVLSRARNLRHPDYFIPYAVGAAMLALLAIFLHTLQATNKLSLLWVLVPLIALPPIILVIFHQTLMAVVIANDVCIALSLLVLAIRYFLEEHGLSGLGDAEIGLSVPILEYTQVDPEPEMGDQCSRSDQLYDIVGRRALVRQRTRVGSPLDPILLAQKRLVKTPLGYSLRASLAVAGALDSTPVCFVADLIRCNETSLTSEIGL